MMQQTETYKLNLIETSDTFSPAPLNENAQKLESALTAARAEEAAARAALTEGIAAANAALSAETATRQSADTALSGRAGAMEGRIAALEADKVKLVYGSYAGNGSAFGNSQIINLGFTPRLVILMFAGVNASLKQYVVVPGLTACDNHGDLLKIVDGGFWASKTLNLSCNDSGKTYHFAALM